MAYSSIKESVTRFSVHNPQEVENHCPKGTPDLSYQFLYNFKRGDKLLNIRYCKSILIIA